MVSLGADGRIASQGLLPDILARDINVAAELAASQQVAEKLEDTIDGGGPIDSTPVTQSAGKLVVAEETVHGHIGWSAGK